jgi:uncharacterized SAM-binding protein YcdF (DUF218 family)
MDTPQNPGAPSGRRACCRILLAFLVCAVLLFGAAAVAVLRAGRWLFVEDPLEKARAIVVLSGRMPVRAEEAAALYRAAWAPEVWITHSSEPGAQLEAMGIPYVGEEFYTARVLMRLGVPASAIRLLEPEAANTAEEVDVIAKQMRESAGTSVIVVTTKPHTRRVRELWRARAGSGLRAIVRAAQKDRFDPEHWWRNTGDALDVVRELLGLANLRAGLPLHPAN